MKGLQTVDRLINGTMELKRPAVRSVEPLPSGGSILNGLTTSVDTSYTTTVSQMKSTSLTECIEKSVEFKI